MSDAIEVTDTKKSDWLSLCILFFHIFEPVFSGVALNIIVAKASGYIYGDIKSFHFTKVLKSGDEILF